VCLNNRLFSELRIGWQSAGRRPMRYAQDMHQQVKPMLLPLGAHAGQPDVALTILTLIPLAAGPAPSRLLLGLPFLIRQCSHVPESTKLLESERYRGDSAYKGLVSGKKKISTFPKNSQMPLSFPCFARLLGCLISVASFFSMSCHVMYQGTNACLNAIVSYISCTTQTVSKKSA